MPNFKKSPAGGPSTMKMYGKGKNPITMKSPMQQSWKAQGTKLTKKGEPKATNTEFKGGYTFDDAFATARKQGFKTFDWKGKSYHTKTKEEV